MDLERIARHFLVALRGKRSQVQWSRRLGYRSNVAYAWESGRRWPTAAETLRATERAGHDVTAAVVRFYGRPIAFGDLTEAGAVAAMLDDLRGDVPITDLARRAGVSRFQLTRWLSGQTQPRLPDFLRVLDAATLRLVDFLACFVDPVEIPGLDDLWRRLQARREGAARYPWTQAVLRGLELADYVTLAEHRAGWVAERLGLDPEVEELCLTFLQATGQITWTGTHWRPEGLVVDTRLQPEIGRQLKAHWTSVAAERLRRDAPGQFSYNVMAVSRAEMEQIRELHLAYFRAVRAVVAGAAPAELVAVVNVQLFELGAAAEPPSPDAGTSR